VAQVALSLLMVVTAALFVTTFDRLARVSLGFDPRRAVVITLSAPRVRAPDRNAFYHRLIRAIREVPGVAHAGGSLNPPLIGTLHGDIVVTHFGEPAPRTGAVVAEYTDITSGWLAAYGTSIRAGRNFDDRDVVGAPPVMVVNETLAQRLGEDPRALVGTQLQLTFRSEQSGDIPISAPTVVGVAENAVFRSVRSPVPPLIYAPLAQRSDPMLWTYFHIAVQATAGSPALLVNRLTETLRSIDPDLMLTFRPVAEQVNESLAQDRLTAWLAGFFGSLALLLAALGLYGVTAHAVAERRGEIGVRMALGATPSNVLRLVLARVSLLVAAGIVAGVTASLWATRFAASLLYGIAPRDPATLAAACAVLIGVAAVAGAIPAHRASRIDPAQVLRDQ
jgi:predicted permease